MLVVLDGEMKGRDGWMRLLVEDWRKVRKQNERREKQERARS